MLENQYLIYAIVFVSQILLTSIRIVDIKSTYDDQKHFSALIGAVGALIWFFSTAVGLDRFINQDDYFILLIFVLSAILGRYFGFSL
jgi:hypothetical protein